jgi:hypothetical protein
VIAFLALLAGLQGGDAGELRRVEGRVARGTREAQQPLANQFVVLHRVGRDKSGPLDSTRTSAKGTYSFRYRPTGDSSAIYFATTSYGGIIYPTPPFRGAVVSFDDASITVFDTTSAAIPIKVGGRHLIIGGPQPNGRRPVGEVYDLENDTTVTAIARDSVTPVWTAQIPASATEFQVNTNGELSSGALMRRGSTVGVYAPISPGIRQVAFTYELPSDAFPLTITAGRPTGVLEVLVQEPTARVQAPAIREVPSANAEGRVFRRFLAQDVPPSGVLRIDVPRMSVSARESIYRVVLYALLAVMGIALVVAFRRRRPASLPEPAPPVAIPDEPRSRALVRAIATLDDDFERHAGANGDRAEYEATRASLKRELADALAAERRASSRA